MSSQDRTLAARIAAHSSWANTNDRTARTEPARAAFRSRFESIVDPEGTLAPDVRRAKADSARRAYFLGLAKKSADARRRRSEAADLRALADELEAGGPDAA